VALHAISDGFTVYESTVNRSVNNQAAYTLLMNGDTIIGVDADAYYLVMFTGVFDSASTSTVPYLALCLDGDTTPPLTFVRVNSSSGQQAVTLQWLGPLTAVSGTNHRIGVYWKNSDNSQFRQNVAYSKRMLTIIELNR